MGKITLKHDTGAWTPNRVFGSAGDEQILECRVMQCGLKYLGLGTRERAIPTTGKCTQGLDTWGWKPANGLR